MRISKEGECAGKRVFWSYKKAKEVARRLKIKGEKPQHPYRCNYCHAWHLTSRRDIENRIGDGKDYTFNKRYRKQDRGWEGLYI
jgi:hypothetical protein